MNKKITLLAAMLLGGVVSPVSAQTHIYCVNCVTETTGQRIFSAVNQAQERIVGAIQGASTAQSAAAAETGKMVADANTKTSADMKKLEAQIQYVPLDPCAVTAAARGGSAASKNRPSGTGRGGSAPTPTAGATSEMTETLKIANGAIPAPPPELAAAMAAKGACGTFAKGDLRENACRAAGFSVGVSSGFPNADIKAETLFDGPQSAADQAAGVNRKLTIKPGNSPERMAVNAFVRNLETATDLRTLTAAEVNSEAGRNYMALRDTYDAAMSLATKPLRDQEGLITANKTTIPIIKQLLKSQDGPYVNDYLGKAYPAWQTDGISYAQLMDLEASRRYLNEDWHVRIAGATEKQLMTEHVQMLALQGWVNTSILERLQQVAILQGTVAGAGIRSEKMPLLVAAHKAAKR